MFGWITPRREFFEVSPCDHFDEIARNAALSVYAPDLADRMEGVRGASEGCEERSAAGEHGEWHIYEMALDDAKSRTIRDLYAAGCLRVGTPYGEDALCFEGSPSGISRLMQFCKDFAEDRGKTCLFEGVGSFPG